MPYSVPRSKAEVQESIYRDVCEHSSFKATFTDMDVTECMWLAHDGQKPDEE